MIRKSCEIVSGQCILSAFRDIYLAQTWHKLKSPFRGFLVTYCDSIAGGGFKPPTFGFDSRRLHLVIGC